jgi:hypothetical protein
MGALDERGRNSARFEVSGSFVVEMLLGGDFEAQMLHGRCRPWAHGCRLSSRPRRERVLRSPSSLLEAERRKKKARLRPGSATPKAMWLLPTTLKGGSKVCLGNGHLLGRQKTKVSPGRPQPQSGVRWWVLILIAGAGLEC